MTRFELTDHQNIHTGEEPYSCHICEKRFKSRKILYDHRLIHQKPHECTQPHCDFATQRPCKLVAHLKTVHGIQTPIVIGKRASGGSPLVENRCISQVSDSLETQKENDGTSLSPASRLPALRPRK